MNTIIAHAAYVRFVRIGGQYSVLDDNTGKKIGYCDTIRGFAHYGGIKGRAHEGVTAVVAGGIDGLREALRVGLRSGRDDRAV